MSFGDYYGGEPQTLFFDPDSRLFMATTGGRDGTLIVVSGGIVDSRSETVAPGDGFIPAPTEAMPGS
jgi:hypothetical protein